MVLFDDADLDAAVEWIMFGVFWNQGEVCSATSKNPQLQLSFAS